MPWPFSPPYPRRQNDLNSYQRNNSCRLAENSPLTVRPDPARPGHYVRDPFPGNIIPASRIINPTYGTYLKFLPTPNNLPVNNNLEPLNDYIYPAEPYNWAYKAIANRYDYALSEKHRSFGRWNWLQYREDRQDWTYETARGLQTNGVNRNNIGISADYVFTPTASTIFAFEAGANHNQEGNILTQTALQYTPGKVGLPGYLDAKAGANHALPIMQFAGYDTLGQPVPAFTNYEILSFKGNALHIRGAHTFRAGIDIRDHRRNAGDPGVTSGQFSFTNTYTSREDDCQTQAGTIGHSWAAFQLGLPTTSSIDTKPNYAFSNPYIGWYGQDNWRVSSKLTVNIGLRMEYEFALKERYNRFIGGFDPTPQLPFTETAKAAYAAKPIPELAASSFNPVGGSYYPGVGNNGVRYPAAQLMFLPRIAVAYQWNSKMVVRTGYGVYYDTLNAQNLLPDQSGFSLRTTNVSSVDFGQNFTSGNPRAGISPLTDPFPVRADETRYDAPVGSALGSVAKAGNGWTFLDPDYCRARQQRWRFDLQRQIGTGMVVSLAYAGMYSGDLRVTRRVDALPAQYWNTTSVRNDALATNLNQNVANPYFVGNFASLQSSNPTVYSALAARAFFTSPTIRKNQLLRPFSQLNLLNETGPYGSSKAHSFEAVFQRRFAQGFTLNANFTGLRERDRDFYYNEFDPSPSYRQSNNGIPRRFAATGIYELPFGTGKAFAQSGVSNAVLGGWQIAAAYEWQPGQLID